MKAEKLERKLQKRAKKSESATDYLQTIQEEVLAEASDLRALHGTEPQDDAELATLQAIQEEVLAEAHKLRALHETELESQDAGREVREEV